MAVDKLDKELENDFKGHNSFLFDMDGTIIQSEPIHCIGTPNNFKDVGLNLKLSTLENDFIGLPDPDVYRRVFKEGHYGPILSKTVSSEDEFIDIKNKVISKIIENIPSIDFQNF